MVFGGRQKVKEWEGTGVTQKRVTHAAEAVVALSLGWGDQKDRTAGGRDCGFRLLT